MLLGETFFRKVAITTQTYLSLLTSSAHICNYLLIHEATENQTALFLRDESQFSCSKTAKKSYCLLGYDTA
jgi:hypothetical protein